MNWKTVMYQSIIEAQNVLSKADYQHTVGTLENLIGKEYWSGNEEMERYYRDTLRTYEKAAYDL